MGHQTELRTARPFKGFNDTSPLRMNTSTAALIETHEALVPQRSGGSCNSFNTQGHVAACITKASWHFHGLHVERNVATRATETDKKVTVNEASIEGVSLGGRQVPHD